MTPETPEKTKWTPTSKQANNLTHPSTIDERYVALRNSFVDIFGIGSLTVKMIRTLRKLAGAGPQDNNTDSNEQK